MKISVPYCVNRTLSIEAASYNVIVAEPLGKLYFHKMTRLHGRRKIFTESEMKVFIVATQTQFSSRTMTFQQAMLKMYF